MSECSKNALVSLHRPWKIVVDLFFTITLTVFTPRFRRSFSNLGLVPLEKKAKKKNTVYISASEAGRAVVWGGERVVSPFPVHSSARFAPRLKFLGKSHAKKRKTNCANITSFPCSVLLFKYSSRPISVREIAQFPWVFSSLFLKLSSSLLPSSLSLSLFHPYRLNYH